MQTIAKYGAVSLEFCRMAGSDGSVQCGSALVVAIWAHPGTHVIHPRVVQLRCFFTAQRACGTNVMKLLRVE